MRTLSLFVLVFIGLILMVQPVRRVVLHAHVLHFLRILFKTTCVFLLFGMIALTFWYWRTYVRPALPRTSWNDTTVEQDLNPETPQKGGNTITPTIIR